MRHIFRVLAVVAKRGVMEQQHLFRLCHVCSSLNEGFVEIPKCTKCGKRFLPLKYFDKTQNKIEQLENLDGAQIQIPTNPIFGLIVFW